jgi:DNA invertase Pin-like site-specific DNA recombinase
MTTTTNPEGSGATPMYARLRDLEGMQFGILARMSNEAKRRKRKKDREEKPGQLPEYMTGMDVDTRELQVTRVTRHLESRGASIVYTYDEPHTSAWKKKRIPNGDGTFRYEVVRPVYRRALKDLQRGIAPNGERLDGLFAVELDRVTRSNRDLEDAIDAVAASDRPILDLTGTLDLRTDNGQSNARVMVTMKNNQSADTSRRVRDMHDALRDLGIPTGGHRPFGWNEDKRTLNEFEANELRIAIKALIAGTRSKTSIVKSWNDRGILSPRGAKWRGSMFTLMLRNPRLCGYRSYTITREKGGTGLPLVRYEYDKDGNATPVIGRWDRIIAPEEFTALQEVLGTPAPRGSGQNTRVYMGVGTFRCGKDGCDMPLRGAKTAPSLGKPPGHFKYVCATKSQGGCAGVAIDGPEADEALRELVLAKWEKEAAERSTAQTPEPWSGQDELDHMHENMAALKKARAAKLISAERYYKDLAEYEAEEGKLIRARNKAVKKAAAAAEAPVNLRADWESGKLSLEEKRDYIAQVVSTVVIHPAGNRRNVPVIERWEPVAAREED